MNTIFNLKKFKKPWQTFKNISQHLHIYQGTWLYAYHFNFNLKKSLTSFGGKIKLCILLKNGSRISWECIKKKILPIFTL
jgi:hypothetical protein